MPRPKLIIPQSTINQVLELRAQHHTKSTIRDRTGLSEPQVEKIIRENRALAGTFKPGNHTK